MLLRYEGTYRNEAAAESQKFPMVPPPQTLSPISPGMDYTQGDHVRWDLGVRDGAAAELQMGNVGESAFRRALFGVCECASLEDCDSRYSVPFVF
jgi:hypothetical protein